MATEKQLAANKANARKSTGPRSAAGKKRSAYNSVRHGLTAKYSGPQFEREVDEEAQRLAGPTDDDVEFDLAHTAATAQLEVNRIREAKAALIDLVSVTGSTIPPKQFTTKRERTKHFTAKLKWIMGFAPQPVEPVVINPADTLPSSEMRRMAEATRRALPELMKLTEYERGAVTRRNRALRALISSSFGSRRA